MSTSNVRPFRLDERGRRPGLAHEVLPLALPPAAASAIHSRAGADGVPSGLWTALVVESERVLETLAREVSEAALDVAARWPRPRTSDSTRLEAYATALRTTRRRRPDEGPLLLVVPFHTFLAWRLAADAASDELREWAAERALRAPRGRHRWEAAAAERGQTLAEWIALQATGSDRP